MGEETKLDELPFWSRHRYLLLIAISMAIATVLVGISMNLYVSSGASQLDLSRPGYSAVQDKVVKSDSNFDNFDANGPIDKATVDQFSDLYQKQSDKAQAVDAFNGDPLNPLIIGLSEDAELPSQQ